MLVHIAGLDTRIAMTSWAVRPFPKRPSVADNPSSDISIVHVKPCHTHTTATELTTRSKTAASQVERWRHVAAKKIWSPNGLCVTPTQRLPNQTFYTCATCSEADTAVRSGTSRRTQQYLELCPHSSLSKRSCLLSI